MYLQLILSDLNHPDMLFNYCLRIPLLKDAINIALRVGNRVLWAQLHDDLGTSLRKCETSNLRERFDQAILAYNNALTVYTRTEYPIEWARVQNGVGLTLMDKMNENLMENLEKAIEAFKSSLEVRVSNRFPREWATSKINLALAYSDRIKGNKKENLKKAIEINDEVLSNKNIMKNYDDLYQTAENNQKRIQADLKSQLNTEARKKVLIQKNRLSKTMKVVRVFDLIKESHFPKYQECNFLRRPKEDDYILMISHRWDPDNKFENIDTREPDPTNIQYHGVVRYLIQACMMVIGSCPNVFNSVDFSEVYIGSDFYMHLADLSKEYKDFVRAGGLKKDKDFFNNLQQLYLYLMQTIGFENTKLVLIDIGQVAYMMSKFVIWYDYTCLPQGKRTTAEEEYFLSELKKTDVYFKNFFSTILWSKKSLKRAWCILEAMAGFENQNWSIFSSENSLIASTKPAKIQEYFHTMGKIDLNIFDSELFKEAGDITIEFKNISKTLNDLIEKQHEIGKKIMKGFNREIEDINFDLSTDLSTILNDTLKNIKSEISKLKKAEIYEYLINNKYDSSNKKDIYFISERLANMNKTNK